IVTDNEEDVQQDVEPVEEQLHHQEVLRPPGADERTQQCKRDQGGRCAPYTDVEIRAYKAFDIITGGQQTYGHGSDYGLQHYQMQADAPAKQDGTEQQGMR